MVQTAELVHELCGDLYQKPSARIEIPTLIPEFICNGICNWYSFLVLRSANEYQSNCQWML